MAWRGAHGHWIGLALVLAACGEDPKPAPQPDAAVDGAVADGEVPDTGAEDVAADVTPVDVLDLDKYTGKCKAGPGICDDFNPCTIDDCDPVAGCVTTLVACADDDPCTLDSCDVQTGGCLHLADTCDDGNLCTDTACVPGEGCTYSPVDCEDGDACTSNGCTPSFGCQPAPVDCDDGQTCTADSCDKVLGCQHVKPEGAACCELPVDCEDGNVCTVHACNAGICSSQGVFGCCKVQADCDDKNPCTLDTCNTGNGQCSNVLAPGPGCCNTAAECDDQQACTLDVCVGNTCAHEVQCCQTAADCLGGGAVDLCAAATCTDGACALQAKAGPGCCAPQVAATSFEAGDTWQPTLAPAATGQWQIDTSGPTKTGLAALRYATQVGAPILGGGPLATAKLAEVTLPAGVPVELSLQYQAKLGSGEQYRLRAVTPLGSWILWQPGTSFGWQQVKVDLTGFAARPQTRKLRLVFEVTPNKNPGTAGFWQIDDVALASTCLPEPCTATAGAPPELTCDDGLTATSEVCSQGACVFQVAADYCESAAACDDGNACTTDTCVNLACKHTKKPSCCLEASECDDQNVCTLDNCVGNKCLYPKLPPSQCCNSAADCDDTNLCTQDLCPVVGLACEHTQTDANCCIAVTDCDDGDVCTIDSCKANQCGHQQQCCQTAADCDDGDPVCTLDKCEAGFCAWSPTLAPGCCEKTIVQSDFEAGVGDFWTLSGTSALAKWQAVTGKQAHGGSGALWYGNAATDNFDAGGASHKGTVTSKPLQIPVGEKTELVFWLWMDTETGPPYDAFDVNVMTGAKKDKVWHKQLVPGFFKLSTWLEVKVDLSAYAGQQVSVELAFDTIDGVANSGKGVYVDDIAISRDCSSGKP